MLKEALIPWRQGKYPQTVRWLRRASRTLEGASGADAGVQRARLYAWEAALRLRQGKAVDAVKWCEFAVKEAESSNAEDALAHAYYVLDCAYFALDRPDEAVFSERALAIYEQLGNLGEQGGILNNLGMFTCLQGQWTDGVELFRRAEEAWEKAGDRFSAAVATVNRGEILSDQGRLEEADPLFRVSLRVARASHGAFLIGAIASVYGRCKARAGAFDDAHELLEEAREANEVVGARDQLAMTDARRAECYLLQGLSEQAHGMAVETLELARAEEATSQLVPMLERVRGEALMQLGRVDEAEEALTESLAVARARGADYEVALALDGLVALRDSRNEETTTLEAERDEIFARLGVASVSALRPPYWLRVSLSTPVASGT
jgi:tetratricopeptide (TPR) repeat protein